MKKLYVNLPFIEFPPTHTCDGENSSPEIEILDLDAQTLAIVALNPYEPGCSFTNWLAWDIPAIPIIPARIPKKKIVASPVRAVQGTNDYGILGYSGPCPKHGETHRITFKIYGLDGVLDLAPGSRKDELISAMKGHVVQFGTTMAMYRR